MQFSNEMQSAWTQYWKNGHTESLPQDRAAGVLAALDSAWGRFFSRLPDRATLLDIATGGGDVIRRAIALGRDFHVTGIDLADLAAVSASLQVPGIQLIGNTDVSKLPFPDAIFDGVTSQFGIEYGDVTAATREAMRVLAPAGRGHFVLHHATSSITQGVADSLAAFRSVFMDSSAFGLGRGVFELYQRSAPAAAIAEAEAEFRKSVGTLHSRLRNERAFGPARETVILLANLAREPRSQVAADALRKLDGAEEQVRASTLRKTAQMSAALDRSGIDNIARLLTAAGAIVAPPQQLRYPMGKIMAWSLSFHK